VWPFKGQQAPSAIKEIINFPPIPNSIESNPIVIEEKVEREECCIIFNETKDRERGKSWRKTRRRGRNVKRGKKKRKKIIFDTLQGCYNVESLWLSFESWVKEMDRVLRGLLTSSGSSSGCWFWSSSASGSPASALGSTSSCCPSPSASNR